jgi:hypothetical protein
MEDEQDSKEEESQPGNQTEKKADKSSSEPNSKDEQA